MSIETDATPRAETLQLVLLLSGVLMLTVGAVTGVAALAICGLVPALLGLLIWARGRRTESTGTPMTDRRWWRYPVNIPVSLAAGLALYMSLALLSWIGSR
jgi:hypothetical protein